MEDHQPAVTEAVLCKWAGLVGRGWARKATNFTYYEKRIQTSNEKDFKRNQKDVGMSV